MKTHDFVAKDGTVETTIYYLDCGHRSLGEECPWCKLDRVERHRDILAEAMAEVKATDDGHSDQPISEIVTGCIKEVEALSDESRN